MTRAELLALAARVEAAEGADRELDAAIALALTAAALRALAEGAGGAA